MAALKLPVRVEATGDVSAWVNLLDAEERLVAVVEGMERGEEIAAALNRPMGRIEVTFSVRDAAGERQVVGEGALNF